MAYKYVPPVVSTLFVCINATSKKFYSVKTDTNNNRVTRAYGRIGSEPKRIVRTFTSRDETREFAAQVKAKRIAHGYVAVAYGLGVCGHGILD